MEVYVIVGHNKRLDNISARAVYSSRADADAHVSDSARMWFDDRAEVVTLILDAEAPTPSLANVGVVRDGLVADADTSQE